MWKLLELLLLPNDCKSNSSEKSTAEMDCSSLVKPLFISAPANTSRNAKFTNFFLAASFLSFALMQLNDPDPLRWTLVYAFVSVVCLYAGLGRCFRFDVLLGGLAVCLAWLLILLPEFVSWVQMGMPTISGSMKAEVMHIEYTREFLGLALCALVLCVHLQQSRNLVRELKKPAQSSVHCADVEQN